MSQLKYLLLLAVCSLCAVANGEVINCYYNSLSYNRLAEGKFDPSNIDPKMCTHLSYTYFGIEESGEFKVLNPSLDIDKGFIKQVVGLKQINPKLKVIAVVGGWHEGSTKYSRMAADAGKREIFIASTVRFLQEHGFDGLNVDWDIPTQGGGSHVDKKNLVVLLKELKAILTPLKFELGLGVDPTPDIAAKAYDISSISQNVDYINVMAFDYGRGSQGFLGLNAPLREQGGRNVETTIKYWLDNGAPSSKLILGLPMYGHNFHLANLKNFNPGFPAAGPGNIGPFSGIRGFLTYNEICRLVPTWTNVFAETHGVPYIYHEKHWVSYDNSISLNLKMDFIKSMNLGGAMLFTIDSDDFRGDCGEKFPLLGSVNRKLNNDVGQTELEPVPPSTGDCSKDGFYPNESDCQFFYQCDAGKRYDFVCGVNTKFSKDTWTCVWPSLWQAGCVTGGPYKYFVLVCALFWEPMHNVTTAAKT